ncbi:MAG: hypothetical protein WC916_06115 [Candidatus Woesearchaeota archaeon]
MHVTPTICSRCGNKIIHRQCYCILRDKIKIQQEFNEKAKKEFSGENYNVFVGRFGYPNINVGLLNTNEMIKEDDADNPHLWADNNYQIEDVITKRSNLINSNFKTQIKGFKERYTELAREISLAKEPVDTEIRLEKKPQFSLTLHQEAAPHGPKVNLEFARATENIKIPQKVDKIVNDDLKASEGLQVLSDKGFDEHYLTKIFSTGNLGLKGNKKLVPTRWSITAVDDTLGKGLIEEIKDFKSGEYCAYFSGYLGNYYLILCFPETWSYELFEISVSSGEYSTDHEWYGGRKNYATDTVGGYYAARLSILQRLQQEKRQSAILALRFITDEYWAPLGVWVVRESSKKSMMSTPIYFSSMDEMMQHAMTFSRERFHYDIAGILKESKLYNQLKKQKKLWEY